MFDSPEVKYNPVVESLNNVLSSLSPFKLVRWVAACPETAPTYGTKERLVKYVADMVEFATGTHVCKSEKQSFIGRLGRITKHCSIVFVGVLGFTGAVYGISVGLEKTGVWLQMPWKCMLPQTGITCFGETVEREIDGVMKKVQEEAPCPLVEGPCTDGEGIKKTLANWSTKVGEWMVTSAKEGQTESLSLASYLLLPIYGVTVAAPNWIATKATEWKTEQLKTEDLVSDGIKLGSTLFEKIEASWTSVTEQLAKQFSKEAKL
ncbi:MAG: hypothetical protein Q8K75_11730 [Chlamydiales bacterium]|nr:hypothetical protein [Chlamydiales bacterium]